MTAIQRDHFINLEDVLKQTRISRSKWYQMIKDGLAPAPVKLGRRSVWSQNAISDYIEILKEQPTV